MTLAKATVRKSYVDLRGLNLGKEFIRVHDLNPGNVYQMIIAEMAEGETEGTLVRSGFIGGLSKMYRSYDLAPGDEVEVQFDGGVIMLYPPKAKLRDAQVSKAPPGASATTGSVFQRQSLRYLFIEPFAPGNLSRWNPKTEPDVYMVFGVLAEYTDYRYASGASKELLAKLGYAAATKPDAVLIDRGTDEYLMAEFKVKSCEFKSNHKPEDVDVLVCWIDDERNRDTLPPAVLALKTLLEELIAEGDIDL